MLSPAKRRHIAFAFIMAIFTGSFAAVASILYNYGTGPEFFTRWCHTIIVTYPTIVVCILFIAPQVHKFIARIIPLHSDKR